MCKFCSCNPQPTEFVPSLLQRSGPVVFAVLCLLQQFFNLFFSFSQHRRLSFDVHLAPSCWIVSASSALSYPTMSIFSHIFCQFLLFFYFFFNNFYDLFVLQIFAGASSPPNYALCICVCVFFCSTQRTPLPPEKKEPRMRCMCLLKRSH